MKRDRFCVLEISCPIADSGGYLEHLVSFSGAEITSGGYRGFSNLRSALSFN
jgi:hypothetical protein